MKYPLFFLGEQSKQTLCDIKLEIFWETIEKQKNQNQKKTESCFK